MKGGWKYCRKIKDDLLPYKPTLCLSDVRMWAYGKPFVRDPVYVIVDKNPLTKSEF